MARIACAILAAAWLLPAAAPEQEIRAALSRQEAAWNRGDVREFMNAYENSEGVTFVGSAVTRGYGKVLGRYLEKYSSREAMGQLTYSEIEVKMLGRDHASVLGRYRLKRTKEGGGDAAGLFTLIFRKTPAGWKIILDHTSN